MSEDQAYKEIRKLAIKTNKKLKALKENTSRDNPTDMDIIKTTKAMFYEEAIEVLKKVKKGDE